MPDERNGNAWGNNVWVKIIGGILAVAFSAVIGLAITLMLRSSDEQAGQLSDLKKDIAASKVSIAEALRHDLRGLSDGIVRLQGQVDTLSADVKRIEEHITRIRMWAERGGAGGEDRTPSPDPPPHR